MAIMQAIATTLKGLIWAAIAAATLLPAQAQIAALQQKIDILDPLHPGTPSLYVVTVPASLVRLFLVTVLLTIVTTPPVRIAGFSSRKRCALWKEVH
jgi:hypothetical protein